MLRSLVHTSHSPSILFIRQVQLLRIQTRNSSTNYEDTDNSVQTIATSNSTKEDTNVHRGTAYEKTAEQVLARLGIDVARCGGAGDRGIDLRGWWTLRPSSSHDNNENSKESVALREQSIGILLSAKGFGQHAIREWRCSIAPLVLVDLPADSDYCMAIRWNDMAARHCRVSLLDDLPLKH
ncbi:hypothetical protein BDF22DRAFT_743933 [Syncephalis plumigaleata]|nr:hypothetical protein BDF22DRAFT_743933 [Syncephalis plumigaleata]